MRWISFVSLLVLAVLVGAEDELPLAEPCDAEACQLPDCRCSATDIPGGLAARDTPQFVTVTFDDGINVLNIETYRELFYGRFNSANNCPIGGTFYVSHEYTNYRLVNELYNAGLEVALHSISHQNNQDYWRDPTYEQMWMEFADQMLQMAYFANVPFNELRGVRKPLLEMGGNITMQVIADAGLQYDCSWTTINFLNPGLWPYTLDYASVQDCQIPPCPTASIPGVWIAPMIALMDPSGFGCGMADQCPSFQGGFTAQEYYEFLLQNFERHYMGNRAPFGYYIHEWYFTAQPAAKEGFLMFLDTITQLNDAFVVNTHEVIDWVKNPVPVNEYRQRGCRNFQRTTCMELICPPLVHGQTTYWLTHCAAQCPNSYPWLGNPLGL